MDPFTSIGILLAQIGVCSLIVSGALAALEVYA